MSELAFNLNGEPFELPGAAVGWRVRKMKPKGAPEVVYSRDGIPLILPIDADIDDLRRAARSEGRFRLDPVDEHNRMIANANAGYVCVPVSDNPPELVQLASRAPTDNVAIEAMKLNTELARSIIDKFPLMIESAAALLRAADSAGITTRPPRIIADDPIEDDDQDEDDEDDDQDEDPGDEAAPKASGLVGLIETLAPFVMPAVMNAIAGGKIKIPGGIGALLDCRRARPKVRAHGEAPASHATSAPGAAPAPGPRDPAPARGATGSTHPAPPRGVARSGGGFARPRASGAQDRAPVAGRPTTSPETMHAPASGFAAASAPTGSSMAPSRPASGIAPVNPTPTNPTTAEPLSAASPSGLHDEQSAASASPPAPEATAERSPVEGVPPSQVARRDEAAAEFDTSASRSRLHVVPAEQEPEFDMEEIDEANDEESALAIRDESATESEDELPTLDAATLAHFIAIQGALTFREGMLARAMAAELTPAELRAWMAELRELSVADAAARIRSVLEDDAGGGTTGGGS
jgi:hypothetical protein